MPNRNGPLAPATAAARQPGCQPARVHPSTAVKMGWQGFESSREVHPSHIELDFIEFDFRPTSKHQLSSRNSESMAYTRTCHRLTCEPNRGHVQRRVTGSHWSSQGQFREASHHVPGHQAGRAPCGACPEFARSARSLPTGARVQSQCLSMTAMNRASPAAWRSIARVVSLE